MFIRYILPPFNPFQSPWRQNRSEQQSDQRGIQQSLEPGIVHTFLFKLNNLATKSNFFFFFFFKKKRKKKEKVTYFLY